MTAEELTDAFEENRRLDRLQGGIDAIESLLVGVEHMKANKIQPEGVIEGLTWDMLIDVLKKTRDMIEEKKHP